MRYEGISRMERSGDVTGLADALNKADQNIQHLAVGSIMSLTADRHIMNCGTEPKLNMILKGSEERYRVPILATMEGSARGTEIAEGAILDIIDPLISDEDPLIRLSAIATIMSFAEQVNVGNKTSIDPLNSLLSDEDSNVRSGAAAALAFLAQNNHMGDPSSISFLNVLLSDLDPDVQVEAVKALFELSEAANVCHLSSLKLLCTLMRKPSKELSEVAEATALSINSRVCCTDHERLNVI